jgi:protein-tyrosine-phosphatase
MTQAPTPPDPSDPPDREAGSSSPSSPDRGLLVEAAATLTRPARRLGRRGLHALERLLHPRRHRRVRREILSRGPVEAVLFVCYGNICRSPYAQYRLERLLHHGDGTSERTPARTRGPAVEIASVGFAPPGRPPPPAALEAAVERGIDMTAHRSRTLTMSLLRRADVVLVMTSPQARDLRWRYGRPDVLHLGDLEPGPISFRDITDPYGHPLEVFREVYERIDRAVGTLHLLLERAAPARRDPDVEPF